MYLKPQSRCAAGAVVSFFVFLSVERSVFRGTGEEERGCERQGGKSAYSQQCWRLCREKRCSCSHIHTACSQIKKITNLFSSFEASVFPSFEMCLFDAVARHACKCSVMGLIIVFMGAASIIFISD